MPNFRPALWIRVLGLALIASRCAAGSFVYETDTEFFSSGDFNGDGRADAVVVDKQSGNARVGYQDSAGNLSWSGLFQTGIAHPTSLGVGRFFSSDRDAIAVTSIEASRVYIVDLSVPPNSSSPRVVTPSGIGPYAVAGLAAPLGSTAALDSLAIASAFNPDPSAFLLQLYAIGAGGIATYQSAVTNESLLEKVNSLTFGGTATTYLAGMARGTNDAFAAYGYVEQGIALYRGGLAPGTEYAFGRFRWGQEPNLSSTALFFVPGQSNIIAQRVTSGVDGPAFSEPVVTTFSSAVERVFYVDEGTNGLGVIRFGDGVMGARVDGSGQIHVTQGLGLGPDGNVITGVVPIGLAKFALLVGNSNSLITSRSQVYTQSGGVYAQSSASDLPATTSNGTRANVWLFANDPFVTPNPTFVASIHGGDWIASLSGLPTTVSVIAETDRGVTSGLGNPAAQSFGSPSLNATFGVPNQYHPTISLFSYSGARAAEPVLITISPLPGNYESPITVSFSTRNLSDRIQYRVGNSGLYRQYAAPFTLGTNADVQFYGIAGDGQRSALQIASYTFTPRPALLSTNSSGGGTNPPPGSTYTNDIATYPWGTVVYGRRSGNSGSIWAIHLDGSGDRRITDGARPRVSPDGRYLAFLRGADAFQNRGDIWIRDLSTGQERLLYPNNDTVVYYDWDRLSQDLILDYFCKLWRLDMAGNLTPLLMINDCNDDAPAVNPMDGRIAFHNLGQSPTVRGIYVAPPDGSSKQRLTLPPAIPRFPAWSPDGQLLALADGSTTTLEGGQNLWVVDPAGAEPHQITGFSGTNAFPFGVVWSPAGDALIGVANLNGVNGIWVVVLTPDRAACGSPPYRLPTTPGDRIDIVGNAFLPPPPPALLIRSEVDHVTVTWPIAAWGSLLEAAPSVDNTASWTTIPQPYILTNGWFEYRVPLPLPQTSEFYRLRQP